MRFYQFIILNGIERNIKGLNCTKILLVLLDLVVLVNYSVNIIQHLVQKFITMILILQYNQKLLLVV